MLKSTKADFSPAAVMEQMPLQGAERGQLERIVLAGTKVMFDQRTHKLMLDQLGGEGPVPDKLGQGIAGLLGMLWAESGNSLPPKLMIPAGVVLLAHAVAFLREAGEQVTDAEMARAMTIMANTVMEAAGLDPAKVAAAGERGMSKQGAA